MKELKELDLQLGDILIFENQDFDPIHFGELLLENQKTAAFYLLLYLIPWFDPGDNPKKYKNIYHAAIWGNVDIFKGTNVKTPQFESKIVQAGTHGIGSDHLYDIITGSGVKNVYVYRRKLLPVEFYDAITTATRSFYNQNQIKYSYSTAWLLAVICSLRYTDGTLHKLLEDKLGEAWANFIVKTIVDLINIYQKEHEEQMVACSTLVAMIYDRAGYSITLKEKNKDKPLNIPTEIVDALKVIPAPKVKAKEIPTISNVSNLTLTPRQLLESPDVELLGYFPFKK